MKILVTEKFRIIYIILTFLRICSSQYNQRDIDYNDQVEDINEIGVQMQQTQQTRRQLGCTFELDGSCFCDCGFTDEELTLPTFGGTIFQIILVNCKTLRIVEDTFSQLPHLSWVRFHNIEQLILDSKSLLFSRNSRNFIQLEFVNTVIEELSSHSISGNIEQIRFENTRIGVIQPFAITGIRQTLSRLSILESSINRIEPQAFKKFSVEEFEIMNTTFISDIPSRSFYDIEVTENLRIRNCNFAKIHSSAFEFQEVSSFSMINNQIEQLNGESIKMQVRDSITIRNNDLGNINNGAFCKIILDSKYFTRNSESIPFNFISNSLDVIGGPQTIIFYNRFNMRISQLYFKTPLTCAKKDELMSNAFLTSLSDTIYFRMSDQLENTEKQDNYVTLSYILNHKCLEESYMIYIIIGIVILIVVLVIILTFILCICWKRRQARKLNIIMPEGKTYRETQIVMQIENHGLLKTDL